MAHDKGHPGHPAPPQQGPERTGKWPLRYASSPNAKSHDIAGGLGVDAPAGSDRPLPLHYGRVIIMSGCRTWTAPTSRPCCSPTVLPLPQAHRARSHLRRQPPAVSPRHCRHPGKAPAAAALCPRRPGNSSPLTATFHEASRPERFGSADSSLSEDEPRPAARGHHGPGRPPVLPVHVRPGPSATPSGCSTPAGKAGQGEPLAAGPGWKKGRFVEADVDPGGDQATPR